MNEMVKRRIRIIVLIKLFWNVGGIGDLVVDNVLFLVIFGFGFDLLRRILVSVVEEFLWLLYGILGGFFIVKLDMLLFIMIYFLEILIIFF